MNLITDRWIPITRQNGQADIIAPWQIAEADNPVVEINAPRPDFQGALYQWLIGLLQTCFAPKDEDEWQAYWQDMPEPEILQASFAKVAFAFELDNPGGAAFMQDYELTLVKDKQPIEYLLIGAPGENTVSNNTDLFQKRHQFQKLCSACAAIALFTLQTNGPPGGAGHMAGLRANGPLTTLVMPKELNSPLFKSLWLNVLPDENESARDSLRFKDGHIFPWLTKTRTSESCTTKKCETGCRKCGTFPSDVDSLHVYWSMPRRIRLLTSSDTGECDICAKKDVPLFKSYVTKNKGYRYVGAWEHPLTPYQKSKNKLPNPIKGQKAGSGYQHWVGLVLQDEQNNFHAASIVNHYHNERAFKIRDTQVASLWCFGYDMEPGQAKSRCWYDQKLPLFHLEKAKQKNVLEWAGELISRARETVALLRESVKSAWFNRPKDVKGDMSQIDAQFWQATEPDFYRLLEQLATLPADARMAPAAIYASWYKTLERQMLRIFETATLAATPEDLDLKRIVNAQKNLRGKFYGSKTMKALKAKGTTEEAA